jgi:putative sigma-54 modulation protein
VFANGLPAQRKLIFNIRSLFMSLRISGHHLEVTPAIEGYVSDKFARVSRHFDQVTSIKVLLSIENEREKDRRQKAECSIHVKGHDFFAETAHADLYAAIDLLVDKIDHQVAKHKTKVQNHHHAAAKRLVEAEVAA